MLIIWTFYRIDIYIWFESARETILNNIKSHGKSEMAIIDLYIVYT
jgi:thermostable 8-oxoguanine DNA glycosylase